jgi:hypothetical protein
MKPRRVRPAFDDPSPLMSLSAAPHRPGLFDLRDLPASR